MWPQWKQLKRLRIKISRGLHNNIINSKFNLNPWVMNIHLKFILHWFYRGFYKFRTTEWQICQSLLRLKISQPLSTNMIFFSNYNQNINLKNEVVLQLIITITVLYFLFLIEKEEFYSVVKRLIKLTVD